MKDTEHKFFALTPIDDADIRVYESAFDFVFAHDDVRNVAVSGSYGSGKSSILASYKKKHGDKTFLHISLAHFQSVDRNSYEVTYDNKERKLIEDYKFDEQNQKYSVIRPRR